MPEPVQTNRGDTHIQPRTLSPVDVLRYASHPSCGASFHRQSPSADAAKVWHRGTKTKPLLDAHLARWCIVPPALDSPANPRILCFEPVCFTWSHEPSSGQAGLTQRQLPASTGLSAALKSG